ncbi:unnamed protein product [Rhizoctonia solani]|uniref:Uncharacterized protein n=1 Tax=Rhizoctonia solani TaxID=456999 RepID=A0A8H3HGZ1_9AGAM|nr:unnamed protein product [Rhizoctonia solani]
MSGRWVLWRSRQFQQRPADALANWAAQARAEVEWTQTQQRKPDNTVIHTVTPILTCIKYHALSDSRGVVLNFPYGDIGQVKKAIDDWAYRHRRHYELIEYTPIIWGSPQSYNVSIMDSQSAPSTIAQE